ncbi:MAG TPA: ferritin-like domain-containing protein [Polyangiaceae bacterium]|nr:ferritin-like domain-containing protein [Polyangiaceae bacterium]
MFRTPISKQASVLRASLLLSLGLSAVACASSDPSPSNGGGGSAGAAGSGAIGTCPDPMVDSATGLVNCSNGLKHRAEAVACMVTASGEGGAGNDGSSSAGAAGSAEIGDYCRTHADCAGLPFGFCDIGVNGAGMPSCSSGCAADSDCKIGQICLCNGESPGRCSDAGCATDADCGESSFCALRVGPCGDTSFHCTTPEDECNSPADCGEHTKCYYFAGKQTCTNAVCGRPFLIADAPRMAALEPRTDWLDAALTPNPVDLTPLERARLAAHWARLGQMEHASIAAFARFNLQLLSLGAPSHLVEACNRALSDETAHARSCFALASAYGGTDVGPAKLDIAHCFEDASLESIAKLVLREGCLGETVAALEAAAAAELAVDPTVKLALTRIASDERDHAELAFQFLRWALSVCSIEARHELARSAAQQLADFESEARNRVATHTDPRLVGHGLLEGDELRAVHLAAARDVSRPLLAALFQFDSSEAA